MEQFTSFMSNVAQSGMGGDMVQMFGVMPNNPDSWLQEKGQEVGREVMGKLMQSVYQADGMEPPADAIVSRSFTPADLISNTGLGGGKMAHILAPLIAGIVSSITQSGITNHIVNFATKRVGKTIEEHSDSIARHGERGGGGNQDRGPGGAADTVIQAVMKPVARGVNSALKKPGLLQKLVDAVSGLVPIEKIKKALKTTLYPQYQKACRVVAPMMQKFGGVAGVKIIEFLQKLTQLTGQADVEKARDFCIENTMRSNEAVERDLMGPIMQPFMSGVLWKLAQSGWKNEIAMGMLKKLFGSCTACFGGKMPQIAGGGQQQGGQYQQQQGSHYQQQQGGQFQGGQQNQGGSSQGGAFMQGQRF